MESSRCRLVKLQETDYEDVKKIYTNDEVRANHSSCKLLVKVGMTLEKTVQRYGAEQAIYGIEKTINQVTNDDQERRKEDDLSKKVIQN